MLQRWEKARPSGRITWSNNEMTTLQTFIENTGGITKAAKLLGVKPQQLVDMRKAKKPVFVDELDRKVYGLLREY